MAQPKGSVPWNAGTSQGWTDKRGYRWRYITVNGKRRAVREHRYVMREALGRELEPWEIVHHKDGNRSNNDPSNLQLFSCNGHHTHYDLKGRPGKKWTDEQRQKASDSHKGYHHSPESRAKMSAAQKGRTRTPEQRQRMSDARKLYCRQRAEMIALASPPESETDVSPRP